MFPPRYYYFSFCFFEVIYFLLVFFVKLKYFKSAFPLSSTFFLCIKDFILGNWGVLKPVIYFHLSFFLSLFFIHIKASFFYRQPKKESSFCNSSRHILFYLNISFIKYLLIYLCYRPELPEMKYVLNFQTI